VLPKFLATLLHGPDTGLTDELTPFVEREDYHRAQLPGPLLDTSPDLVAVERNTDAPNGGPVYPAHARPAIVRIAVPGLRSPWSVTREHHEARGIPDRMMALRRALGGRIAYQDVWTESVVVEAPPMAEGASPVYVGRDRGGEVIRGASKLGA
jgi:hypothetical protein